MDYDAIRSAREHLLDALNHLESAVEFTLRRDQSRKLGQSVDSAFDAVNLILEQRRILDYGYDATATRIGRDEDEMAAGAAGA